MFQFSSLASGFAFGFSLIVAIGPQNAFVLRQGLLRQHVLAVVAICAASDAMLIAVGVGSMATLTDQLPSVVTMLRVAGALFLTAYGLMAAKRVVRPATMHSDASGDHVSLSRVILVVLAFTWLNPHVYLDTVVLLGSVADSHGDQRTSFGVGAVGASLLWFTALGFGARALRPLFAKPLAWRIFDGVITAIMLSLAASLILST